MIHEASTKLPTEFGAFTVHIFRNQQGQEVTAVCSGEIEGQQNLPVRAHSACFTAEALGSLKCDCKQQLDYALDYISREGGMVLYLPQEGRGIGLSNKIRAYALQEQGHDTIEANRMLGLPIDGRSYEDARDILNYMKVSSIRLLTNNPEKITGLSELGIDVAGRLPVICDANQHSASYLNTKQTQMGHMLRPATKRQKQQVPHRSTVVPLHQQLGQKPDLIQEVERPFVHVNFALTHTSKTNGQNGKQIPISCDHDWQRVHKLREQYNAIAVGARTWQRDQPRLTARADVLKREAKRQPARVIFAGAHACEFPSEAHTRETFVVGHPSLSVAQRGVVIQSTDHCLSAPLLSLREHGVESMLVEGGLRLISSFVSQGLVDLLTVYVRCHDSDMAIKAAASTIPNLRKENIEVCQLGEGCLLIIQLNTQKTFDAHDKEVLA